MHEDENPMHRQVYPKDIVFPTRSLADVSIYMMNLKNLLASIIIILASCAGTDEYSPPTATGIGAWLCGTSVEDMQWLRELIEQARSDGALMGDIYAGPVDGVVLFVHQPLVMSCLACVVYDCMGNRIDSSTLDHEKLRTILTPKNKIYKAHF